MISIDDCRKLDSRLEKMSDEEVRKIRDSLYELGQLVFDTWLEEKGSNISVGYGHENNTMQD